MFLGFLGIFKSRDNGAQLFCGAAVKFDGNDGVITEGKGVCNGACPEKPVTEPVALSDEPVVDHGFTVLRYR